MVSILNEVSVLETFSERGFYQMQTIKAPARQGSYGCTTLSLHSGPCVLEENLMLSVQLHMAALPTCHL